MSEPSTYIDDLGWANAVERAVRDRTVLVFLSAKRLLRAIPDENQDEVCRELAKFEPAQFWCVAYVALDELDGCWRCWQREDRRDVVYLCIIVSPADYAKLPRAIEMSLKAQQERSIWN